MRRRLRGILIIVAIAAVILLLRATLFRPRAVEVEAARVAHGVVEDAVTNSQAGTVRSRLKARVGAERTGRITRLPQREGAVVTRGDLLLELDTSSALTQLDLNRRDLDASKAGVDAARAAAVWARQEFQRAARLTQEGSASQGQFDQAKNRLDSAEAELKAAEARVGRAASAVRLAADELEHLKVQAPFDGVITQRFVEVGESVVPGQPALELMSPDSLYVSAPIDEVDIGRIRPGLPARVSLDPFPGVTWSGVVSRVSPYVNDFKEQNRTLEVEVDVARDPAHPRPKPGTSADVEIILDKREGVLRVPTFSVIEGKRVLMVNGGKAVSRDIRAGLKNWEWTEILGGLNAGDIIITNLDKQGIKPGVRVKMSAPPAGSPP